MKTGIYVHIPFCASRCAYCSFVSSVDLTVQKSYIRSLTEEIRERGGGEADTLYIGGGTPSVLYPGALTEIVSSIRNTFDVRPLCEFTVEANPDSADEAFFTECRTCGVTRVSLGLQSTMDGLLKRIGRRHDYRSFLSAFRLARRFGFDTSVDLMLGIPGQTLVDAVRSVREVSALGPEHMSLYALKVEEETRLFESGFIPDEDLQAEMYAQCYALLKERQFYRYEVSNFARNGRFSRHNVKYWTLAPYIGFGAAAHSFDTNVRRANSTDIAEYASGRREYSEETETPAELREEFIMLSLRTADGLDLIKYSEWFGSDLRRERANEILSLTERGYLAEADGRLRLTEDAYYVMNAVILQLI